MDQAYPKAKRIGLSRRTTVRGLVAGAATMAAALTGRRHDRAGAQEATPATGQCVATAPPADASGIGVASLLVGGIVHDMPPGPVEIRLSRFTMAPGTTIPPGVSPYPALMYIETGTSWCPGDAGKTMYGADGAVLGISNGRDAHPCPAGTTWYIPAGLADGANNEGTELMSSLIVEFVPVADGGTPAAGA